MQYDEVSFLAGLAAGRQLKGWATHVIKGDTQNRDVLVGAYGNMSTYGKYEIYDNASVSIFTSIIVGAVAELEPTNPPKRINDSVGISVANDYCTVSANGVLVSDNPPEQVLVAADVQISRNIVDASIIASMEVDIDA